jgi:zinc transport system substrate-binding protein
MLVLLVVSFVVFQIFFRGVVQKETANGTIHVVASIYPISYITKTIGGNLVTVNTVVHAGIEPHDFEPSPRDIIEIGNADIFIYNGASLEPWIKKWEQSASARPRYTINMASALKEKGVVLLEKNSVQDPHFWLDPLIMKIEAEIVRDALTEVDSMHKDLWNDNTNRAFVALDSLDQRFRAGLSACSLRDIVVLHDAFSYLAKQYGILVTSIEGISPDEEPSPKELARITDLVRIKGVKYIFFETIASPKFSELIAREVGGITLVLNPVESLTPNEVQWGEDYISVMEKNLSNLRKAMLCN